MAGIEVYKRVVDYVGLNVKPVPERFFELFKDVNVALALLQAMGSDGAKLLQADANGSLQVTTAGAAAMPQFNLSQLAGNVLNAQTNGIDGQGNPYSIPVTTWPVLFNGAAYDRGRSASAANLAAQSGLGAALTALPGQWSIVSAPGAGLLASASKAAVAGTRHVCTAIDFSALAAVAPAATATLVYLRDGASGAGTILRQWLVFIPAAIGQAVAPFGMSGLNIVGSVNTAMTLEFAGLLANLQEAVSMSGYDAV